MRRASPRAARLALLTCCAGALAAAGLGAWSPRQAPSAERRWFKGNTHTHTTESDGDSPPDVVARWYRDHGYQFLVLSDHNRLTSVEAVSALTGRDPGFLLIPGEEVSSRFDGRPVHVNGLGIARVVDAQNGRSLVDVLQRSVDAIRGAEGVPHINHPNFNWAFSAEEIRQVRNNRLLEIYNGHPQVNNLGGGGVPGMEEAWDAILSSGTLVYGIAVDDAHNFKDPGNPNVAGPGRGWVAVRAAALEPRGILEALERGDFYASTGVELTDFRTTASSATVVVRTDSWAKYRIRFIGKGGRLLQESLESPATYVFRGDEGYVRAKVIESNGRVAWCQPVMLSR